MYPGFQGKVPCGARPHQLAFRIVQRDPVLAVGNGLGELDGTIYGDRPERGKNVRLSRAGLGDFPAKELRLCSRATL